MNRKQFIKTTAASVALLPFMGLIPSCQYKSGGKKIFVLVQLIGGNDGLNTLIPLDNYGAIKKARPNLFIPEDKILHLKGIANTGLHPALGGIRDLFENNLASFVQGVGYENQSYSHFRSQDIWLAGIRSSEAISTGWMARFLANRYPRYPEGFPNESSPDPPAIKVGDSGTFAFEGSKMDMSIVIDPKGSFVDHNESIEVARQIKTYASDHIQKIRNVILQAGKYETRLNKALGSSFASSKLYPPNGENALADQLKIVAKLINTGIQTSVYHVDLKGFDTHVEQASASDTTKGAHADLLKKISQALTCFWDDINHMGKEQDVCGMVFSEFGRRIMSNASMGTDHGAAQPLLFFGAGLTGQITGHNPLIPEQPAAGDNLLMQYDFKAVYASIVRNWMGGNDAEIEAVAGAKWQEVEIFKKLTTA